MTKKSLLFTALILVVALSVGIFAACNKPFEWEAVTGGDASAQVESQGKFVVKQGNFVYFVNGLESTITENVFGTPIKGSIMRMDLDADGRVVADTAKIIVPLNVYTSDKNAGFFIYGDYIYYAAANTEKDKSGVASTTHLNFMRSKIDGTGATILLTINNRAAEYKFYQDSVVYYDSTEKTLVYADFSFGTLKKITKNVKTIAERVADVAFVYDKQWTPGQEEKISDYIVYTQTRPETEAAFENNLRAVKYNGEKDTLLIDKNSYLAAGETPDQTKEKVFNLALVNNILDGSDFVLYYTKAINLNQTSTTRGLYFNKITLANGTPTLAVANERKLSELGTVTTIVPIGYEGGVLATFNSNVYLLKGFAEGTVNPNVINDESALVGSALAPTILFVRDGYLYYMYSNVVFRISLTDTTDVAVAMTGAVRMSTDWISVDVVGDVMYYFNSEDDGYVSAYDLRQIRDQNTNEEKENAFMTVGYKAPEVEEEAADGTTETK